MAERFTPITEVTSVDTSASSVSDARKKMSQFVKALWTRNDAMFNLKDELSKVAYEKIKQSYERCARDVPGRDFIKCMKEAAKSVNLDDTYRKLWGELS